MPLPSNHKVTNQPPPLAGANAFRLDPLLLQLVAPLGENVLEDLDQLGIFVLTPEAQDLARLAVHNPPQLRTHDRVGNRIDQVEFHPAFHGLMRRSTGYGIHSSAWEDAARNLDNGHLARAIRLYLIAGLEPTHLHALSATHGGFGALMVAPHLAREWGPRLMTRKYDSAHKSPVEKQGLTLAIAVTEKQAGSDTSGLTTHAESVGNGLHRLTGHKWHVAAPMSDAFLMLARTENGISCFLVPRFLAENEPNGIALMRLKQNLGASATAVAEIELNGAIAQMVGREGEGGRVIREMVTLMRLDSAIISAGAMRACVAEAVHHARHRIVGGEPLIEKPLARRVLADIAVETAAATALVMRLASSFDAARNDDAEGAFAHLMAPAVKAWLSRVSGHVIDEAMEISGGNALSAESLIARHAVAVQARRMADGTANTLALDIAQIVRTTPETLDSVLSTLAGSLGKRAEGTVKVLNAAAGLAAEDEGAARLIAEQLALSAAGAELMRLGTGVLADVFCETRLGGTWRSSYGQLSSRFDTSMVLEALYPAAT